MVNMILTVTVTHNEREQEREKKQKSHKGKAVWSTAMSSLQAWVLSPLARGRSRSSRRQGTMVARSG